MLAQAKRRKLTWLSAEGNFHKCWGEKIEYGTLGSPKYSKKGLNIVYKQVETRYVQVL